MIKQELKSVKINGYRWAYNDAGAFYFTKLEVKGWILIKAFKSDLINGNLEYLLTNNLTRK